MIRESIPGMDSILDADPQKGSTILVIGEAGTLKSGFVFNVMCNWLDKQTEESGVYLTLDEKKETHLKNMTSLGIKYTERLLISDVAAFRTDLKSNGDVPVDSDIYFEQIMHILLENVDRRQGKPRVLEKDNRKMPSCYAMDSLNAFLSLIRTNVIEIPQKPMNYYTLRNKLFALLSLLRENNAVNFIIFETTGELYRPEFFLVDGIIELGTIGYKDEVKRYIQIKKMKGIRHRLERHIVEVTDKGIEIVGKIIP